MNSKPSRIIFNLHPEQFAIKNLQCRKITGLQGHLPYLHDANLRSCGFYIKAVIAFMAMIQVLSCLDSGRYHGATNQEINDPHKSALYHTGLVLTGFTVCRYL